MKPPESGAWNRKIDLIEDHYVNVTCTDGRTYKGFGAIPCIGEDEYGEEVDAIRLDIDDKESVILIEAEIESYEIID